MTSNNPFIFQDNRSKIGGFLSLKIAESKNIVQQVSTNTVELPDAIFLYKQEWLAEFGIINKTLAELKLEAQITPNGYLQSPSLKFTTEQDISPQDFQVWFQQNIQGRNLVVQLLNNNELLRTLSPMAMTYTYSGVAEFSQSNKYELVFSRVKMMKNVFNPVKDMPLKKSLITRSNGDKWLTEVNIIFHDFVDSSLYEIKYGETNNPDDALMTSKINNYEDGNYFIFIMLKAYPTIFLTYKLIADSNNESVIYQYNNN